MQNLTQLSKDQLLKLAGEQAAELVTQSDQLATQSDQLATQSDQLAT